MDEDKRDREQMAKFNKGLALLTELKAHSEGRAAETTAIHKEVKQLFRQNFLDTVRQSELEDRVVEIREG